MKSIDDIVDDYLKARHRPVRVLVVEDDEIVMEFVTEKMRRAGFSVDCAVNGQEAIDMATREPYPVMLLDYRLPDMTGEDVIVELEKRGCKNNFIVMTGYSDELIAVEMMRLGASDYVHKDASFMDQLFESVERLVDKLGYEEAQRELRRGSKKTSGAEFEVLPSD